MKVEILLCRTARARGTPGHRSPCLWIKTKDVLFLNGNLLLWRECYSVRLRESSSSAMVWAVIRKLVYLIYIWFFSFTLAAILMERWFGTTCCRGAQHPPSINQVCKKKSPNKELTRIFDFQLLALALELKSKSLFGQKPWKMSVKWFICVNLEKKNMKSWEILD